VAERVPDAHVVLGPKDAAALAIAAGEAVQVMLNDTVVELPLRIRSGLPPMTVGLPAGLPGMPFWDDDTRVTVFRGDPHA
jgi:NADH-quinone oxidoreductase subunit G